MQLNAAIIVLSYKNSSSRFLITHVFAYGCCLLLLLLFLCTSNRTNAKC